MTRRPAGGGIACLVMDACCRRAARARACGAVAPPVQLPPFPRVAPFIPLSALFLYSPPLSAAAPPVAFLISCSTSSVLALRRPHLLLPHPSPRCRPASARPLSSSPHQPPAACPQPQQRCPPPSLSSRWQQLRSQQAAGADSDDLQPGLGVQQQQQQGGVQEAASGSGGCTEEEERRAGKGKQQRGRKQCGSSKQTRCGGQGRAAGRWQGQHGGGWTRAGSAGGGRQRALEPCPGARQAGATLAPTETAGASGHAPPSRQTQQLSWPCKTAPGRATGWTALRRGPVAQGRRHVGWARVLRQVACVEAGGMCRTSARQGEQAPQRAIRVGRQLQPTDTGNHALAIPVISND